MTAVPSDELLDLFVHLAGIASPTGSEREVADHVIARLHAAGVSVSEDASAAATGCACGNLLARIPGRGEAEPLALCAHLDTVPVAHAPRVVVADGQVRSDGETPLGADDKAAVAVLLVLAGELAEEPPAGDVELLFTPGEEAHLLGAKALAPDALTARRVFVFDSDGAPGTMVVAAPTLKSLRAELRGTAAHAGIAPERGRSAVVAAARGIAAMHLGRIDDETTANIGIVSGGTASNVVPEYCEVAGEARSHDPAKAAAQMQHLVDALAAAAAAGGVDAAIDVQEAYRGYRHGPRSPLLATATRAAAAAGLTARRVTAGGGSDANVLNAAGIPALTLGAGFENAHSSQERISLEHLAELHALARALVRVAGEPVPRGWA